MAVVTLPNTERLVIEFLLAHTDVTALVGTRIYTSLPATVSFPAVRIGRHGGLPPVPFRLDAAAVYVEVWADTQSAALHAALTIQAALRDLPGVRAQGVVTGVEDAVGLDSAGPDPDNKKSKYTFAVTVYAHP